MWIKYPKSGRTVNVRDDRVNDYLGQGWLKTTPPRGREKKHTPPTNGTVTPDQAPTE